MVGHAFGGSWVAALAAAVVDKNLLQQGWPSESAQRPNFNGEGTMRLPTLKWFITPSPSSWAGPYQYATVWEKVCCWILEAPLPAHFLNGVLGTAIGHYAFGLHHGLLLLFVIVFGCLQQIGKRDALGPGYGLTDQILPRMLITVVPCLPFLFT